MAYLVYLHLAQQLPAERYIYYADTLNVPYGSRDSDDIEALTFNSCRVAVWARL